MISPCRVVSEREFLELAVSCLWNEVEEIRKHMQKSLNLISPLYAACLVAAVKLKAGISSSPCREVSERVLGVGCVKCVE